MAQKEAGRNDINREKDNRHKVHIWEAARETDTETDRDRQRQREPRERQIFYLRVESALMDGPMIDP